MGAIPVHQQNLTNQYGAAGLNISIPFLNGGLYAARREEADTARVNPKKKPKSSPLQIASGVRVAWIDADNAWRRIDVTAKLVDQAATTLRLANARYEIGLSGILELTQAQLAQTSAQLAAASAKYDYLARLARSNTRQEPSVEISPRPRSIALTAVAFARVHPGRLLPHGSLRTAA